MRKAIHESPAEPLLDVQAELLLMEHDMLVEDEEKAGDESRVRKGRLAPVGFARVSFLGTMKCRGRAARLSTFHVMQISFAKAMDLNPSCCHKITSEERYNMPGELQI